MAGYSEKDPLIKDLKDFIKEKAIVREENISYLEPLVGFVEEEHPISIISLNYDTAIEQFSILHKLTCEDGFSVRWEPRLFHKEYNDINLYKMHGSVMWYQSDRGDHIKVPINTKNSSIELITGERAENLMMYPMQKQDYAEPLLELSVMVKQLLENDNCKFLIVVGYSFRDEHIKRMIWDAGRKNKRMRIVLIDPDSHSVYDEKLKYYNYENKIESSISGRVICLPYYFEGIFPYLRNGLLKSLRESISMYQSVHESELRGENAEWVPTMNSFANAEYSDEVVKLLGISEITKEEIYIQFYLNTYLKLALNLLLSKNRRKEGKYYIGQFHNLLEVIFVKKLKVVVESNYLFCRYNFTSPNDVSGVLYIYHAEKILKDLLDYLIPRKQYIRFVPSEIKKIENVLVNLRQYFKEITDRMDWELYKTKRKYKYCYPEHLEYLRKDENNRLKYIFSNDYSQSVEEVVTETERKIINEIINPSIS